MARGGRGPTARRPGYDRARKARGCRGHPMIRHTAHMARDDNPSLTACGEPWQGWQAPRTKAYERLPDTVELPPHDKPKRGEKVRQCQACLREAIRQEGWGEHVRRWAAL